jgi:hypothetical protein
MAESDPNARSGGAVLEVTAESSAHPAVAQTAQAPQGAGAVLEVSDELLAGALKSSAHVEGSDPSRRARGANAWKKRAEPAEQDGVVQRQLAALLRGTAPILSVLWPDLGERDLLAEASPSPDRFARQWEALQASIDAVARRGFEERNQAAVAQGALDRARANLSARARRTAPSLPDVPSLEALTPAAVAELEEHRDRSFAQWAAGLAGAQRALFARDIERVDAEAIARGLDRMRARALLSGEGITVHEDGGGAWSGCVALPGAPASLDAAGTALLQHPAQAYVALRRGDIEQWLASNDAPADLTDSAREIRRLAERGTAESHVVHTLAWLFGRSEIVLGRAWARTPADLPTEVRAGTITTEDLARAARDKFLGAWLRRAGFSAAAMAADALGRGDRLGLERLAWALGEPLRVGAMAFTDPATLARCALEMPAIREPLERAFASGELLAWMDSLPASRREERWIVRLRRAAAQGNRDPLALWTGVYGALGERARLVVRTANGTPQDLTNLRQLTGTIEVTAMWDGLKAAYRTGELLAWIAAVAPEHDYTEQERPVDDDAGLNELLWEVGHVGMVLEWGPDDLPITTPEDLEGAYRRDWRTLEAALRRGFVLRWLERFHGRRMVGGVTLEALIDRLRTEMPTLPAGYLALKTALLCGMRQLPLEATQPGDDATIVGYVSIQPGQAQPTDWEPLRKHMTWGAGHLWVAQLPNVKATTLPLLMNSAFVTDSAPRTAPDRLLKALAMSLGTPVPSAALRARMSGGMSAEQPARPVSATGQTAPTAQGGLPPGPAPAPAPTATASAGTSALRGALYAVGAAAIASLGFFLARTLRPARVRPGVTARRAEAPPSPCALVGRREALGAGAVTDRGLHVTTRGEQVTVGWVTTGSDGDGIGWARMTSAAVLERRALGSSELRPRPARDQRRTIHRVFALPTEDPLSRPVIDETFHEGSRREVIRCGEFIEALQRPRRAADVPRSADPLADVEAGDPDVRASFFCRTVFETGEVLAARLANADTLRRMRVAHLEVRRPGQPVAATLPWPARVERFSTMPRPMQALREQALTSVESAAGTPGRAIAVSGSGHVHALVESADRPGAFRPVTVAFEGDPGPARVAMGSREALIVWAARAGSSRALFAARVGMNGIARLQALPVMNPSDDPRAPTVVATADGGWIVSWVQRASRDTAPRAWVQRYDAALAPVGAPLAVSGADPAGTARIALGSGDLFTVAYTTEARSGQATVVAVQGRCAPR